MPEQEPTEHCALLVIGSGPAGVSAARAYADAGGSRPVVLASSDVDPPYQRPPLSKEVLAGAHPAEGTPIHEEPLPPQVELRLGAPVDAVDLDARTAHLSGTHLGFERLVLATGADPLPLPTADPGAEVHVLRSLETARRLVTDAAHARTAVVVGSGFIGCEAAASLARRGVRTVLVTQESAPQADRLGAHAAAAITGWLEALGVKVRTEVQVSGVEAPRTVHLDDGTTLAPDLVLTAVGVAPNGALLEGTGVQLHEGRVVVDEHLQAAPGVWVAGDVARAHHPVAGRPLAVEHWGDALAMGEVAGHNATVETDAARVWESVPGFWSTIGERTLKYAAWGDGHVSEQVVERPGGFTVWYGDGDGVLVGVLTHEADDDYERGGELLARHATVEDATGRR